MKIRVRLTILFALTTTAILLVFALLVYLSSSRIREEKFYRMLTEEAIIKATLVLDTEIGPEALQDIYRRNMEFMREVEVALYDRDFNLLYHDAIDIDHVQETPEMIEEIIKRGEIRFYQNSWQVIGVRFKHGDTFYAVTAAAYDESGYRQMRSLLKTIFIALAGGLLLSVAAGSLFAKKAFEPIKEITNRIEEITVTNLDLRLRTGSSYDELHELSSTINEVLNRLENSFESQKSFIHNISHEIRTPLSALTTELELSLTRERTSQEYRQVIERALSDAKRMNRLSNSLLDLAKASYDPSKINYRPIRIDELLLDSRKHLQGSNSDYAIDIDFEGRSETDAEITVNGNEYLIKTAFINLFDNGCKFSDDKTCRLKISFTNRNIVLAFTDNGIGIPEEEIPHIFTPFFRGNNSGGIEGDGIGLSLTKKIIELHGGTINVLSEPDRGTRLVVTLPHL